MKKVNETRVRYLLKSHEDKDDPRPLYRAILFEEYFVLTGDPLAAIVLNQFVYWSQRTNDFDKFIKEENARRNEEGVEEIPLSRGWIYKTSDELSKETMIASESTIRRAIITLVEKKWLSERNNPNHKWDRTLQYRVNLIQLSKDLAKLGYCVPGYKIDLSILQDEAPKTQGESSKTQDDAALPESTLDITLESTLEAPDAETASPLADELLEEAPQVNNSPTEETLQGQVQKVRPTGLPKSITGSGSDEKTKQPRGSNYAIAYAVAKVCNLDFGVKKGAILGVVKNLMKSEKAIPTKQLIYDMYGKDSWWYKSDWRGKQGDAPNLASLSDTWGKWIVKTEDKPQPRPHVDNRPTARKAENMPAPSFGFQK